MCPKCQPQAGPTKISHPTDLHALISALEAAVAAGTMVYDRGTCQLADIRPDRRWPSDLIEILMQCPACGQSFRLGVETFHGLGGTWNAA